jgi:hypothetical protein
MAKVTDDFLDVRPDTLDKLHQLARWALFQETDGYVQVVFTDSGGYELMCGQEVGIPRSFTPDCPHDGLHACACPDTGWVAEFRTGFPGASSTFPHADGGHYVGFGVTYGAAIDDLYAKVLANDRHDCERLGRMSRDRVARWALAWKRLARRYQFVADNYREDKP